MEDLAFIKFLKEFFTLELRMVLLFERKDGQHLQEGDVEVLVIRVQFEAVGNSFELL